MRKLASIQTILSLDPIEGADQILRATVLGWHLVVRKGEFAVGDPCVYFEIDSLLPKIDAFSFMEKDGVKRILVSDSVWAEGYRLRTIKLKGQVSQGLALPISHLAHLLPKDLKPGQDVTKDIGVVKYEIFEPGPVFHKQTRKPVIFPKWLPKSIGLFVKHRWPNLASRMWGVNMVAFPQYIPKTDEVRIQAVPDVLVRHAGVQFYATEKLDGSSITIFHKDGLFGVCSRTIWLPEDPNNGYWKAALALGLRETLGKQGNLALQGELVGEGVQGNKYAIKGQRIYFYQAYDIDKRAYLNFNKYMILSAMLRIETVPYLCKTSLPKTVDEMVAFSQAPSRINSNVPREGVVMRPFEEMADKELGRLTFKAINPDFLLKYKE